MRWMPDVQTLNRALFDDLIERAQRSPRLRINHNFHASMEDNPHRFLNVMAKGTYVAPHRHLDPPKAESFVVLDGEVAFFIFDDAGNVMRTEVLGGDPMGIDLAPGVWHTLTPVSAHAVCYEVKPGPYSAANDKDFAPWAPRRKAIRQYRGVSGDADARTALETSVLDGVHQGMQSGGSEDAGAFLKHLAISHTRDGRQNHVAPIRQRSGAVVEVRASEDEGGNQQICRVGAKSLHDAILDQPAEEDFFGQSGGGEDDQILRSNARWRRLARASEMAAESRWRVRAE